jgi:hypothetical protein
LIKSNALTIGCEIAVLLSQDVVEEEQFRVQETSPRLGDQLYSRMKESVMTDLTLVCGDKRLPCHKMVLAAQSSVFNDLFKHSEADEKELVIKDMQPEVLEKVLKFVYLDNVGKKATTASYYGQ